jgi:membrane-associated phospholipid phosphatase
MRRLLLVALIATAYPPAAGAQQQSLVPGRRFDHVSSGGPRSVYHLSIPRDGVITGLAGLAILVPYAFASSIITPRCPCDPREVNSFDRSAIGNTSQAADITSDVTAALAILVPPALDYVDLGWSKPFREDAGVFVQTIAVNGALVTFAKYVFQRPLPRTYAGDPALISSPRGYRSFYSGHTSLVFAALTAAAMTVTRRHGGSPWPWVIVAVVGTSVALERVAAGEHFPTDVIAGGAAGMANGFVIPLLHRRAR